MIRGGPTAPRDPQRFHFMIHRVRMFANTALPFTVAGECWGALEAYYGGPWLALWGLLVSHAKMSLLEFTTRWRSER